MYNDMIAPPTHEPRKQTVPKWFAQLFMRLAQLPPGEHIILVTKVDKKDVEWRLATLPPVR